MWIDLVFGRLLGVERFREDTIDLLGDIDGKVVLDVACVDYSLSMLDIARARNEQEGWQNVESRAGRRGEACDHRSAGRRRGIGLVQGIVHDLEAALHRAVDVLRPGVRIMIWTPETMAAIIRIFARYLSHTLHRTYSREPVARFRRPPLIRAR